MSFCRSTCSVQPLAFAFREADEANFFPPRQGNAGQGQVFRLAKKGPRHRLQHLLLHDGNIYDEYIGMDYSVALDLHLYFIRFATS